MDDQQKLESLCRAFQELNVEVRTERFGGSGGGFARLRDKRLMILDLDTDLATQVESCIAALAALPEVSEVFLPPTIRERVDKAKKGPS